MSEPKFVLFLDATDDDRGRAAAILFQAAAQKAGLAWNGMSRGLAVDPKVKRKNPLNPATMRDLQSRGLRDVDYSRAPMAVDPRDVERAALVVAFDPVEVIPLLQKRFPSVVDKLEGWSVSAGAGAILLLDRNVANLVSRLGTADFRPTPFVPPPALAPKSPFAATQSNLTVKVGRETAGRRGKGVTTVWDIPLEEAKLLELAAMLKERCGSGGTAKEGRIEIQGDHRDRVAVELEKLGYKVKRAGG